MPACLYQLYYEQAATASSSAAFNGGVFDLPRPPLDLAFKDVSLDPVKEAWKAVMGPLTEGEDAEYMQFQDREGMGDDDNEYD